MSKLITCKECPFLRNAHNKSLGNYKHCWIAQYGRMPDDECYFLDIEHNLDNRQAEKILSYHNKWRRGKKGKKVNGFLVGLAITEAIRCLRKEK